MSREDYDEPFALVGHFTSEYRFLSIMVENYFLPQQLDIKAALLYSMLKETTYLCHPKGYSHGKKVSQLKSCIFGLQQLSRE
jgi:hypothetical protein